MKLTLRQMKILELHVARHKQKLTPQGLVRHYVHHSPTDGFVCRMGMSSLTRLLPPTHGFVHPVAEHSTLQQPRSSYMRSPSWPLSSTIGFICPILEHGAQQTRSSLMHPPSRPFSGTHDFFSPVAQYSVAVSPIGSPFQPPLSRFPHMSIPGGGTAVTTDGSSSETNQTLLSSSHPTQIQGVGIPHVSVPGQLSQLMA